MANEYDGETCEGCVRREWNIGLGGCSDCRRRPDNQESDHDLPDSFAPSLQCRQVRALEKLTALADCTGYAGRGSLPVIWTKERGE